MSFITLPYTFTNGTIAQAPQVDSNFTAVTAVVNGSLDNTNLSSSAAIALSKLGLNPGSTAFNQSTSGQNTWTSGLTTDTQPQVAMTTNAGLQFGPGGSTAPDVSLIRTAANTLQLRTPAGGAAIEDGNGGTLQNFATITLASGGIINLNGGSISGTAFPMVNNGRLYLTSGSAYADGGATGTLYFGPATGNQITLYNGTAEVTQTFSQVSLAVGGLTASSVYDIYCKSASSTTVTLSDVVWSGINTPPTRGTQDGRLTKNGDATSLLVGVIYLNAGSQVTDNTSTRGVSNLYNPVPRALYCTDNTGGGWTYSTSTCRAANANTTDGVGRVSFVSALGNNSVAADSFCTLGEGGSFNGAIGIGLNSITAFNTVVAAGGAAATNSLACSYAASSLVGYNYIQRLEQAYGGTSVSYSNVGTIVGAQNALTSSVFN
jgi:hypothetical protein